MLADHRSQASSYMRPALPPPNLDEEARLAEQAKAFIASGKMIRLPYSGERSSLKFDRRTHAPFRHRKKPFSDKLAWSDVQNGMHIRQRATAHEMRMLYTPEFSKNDDQLRLAIAQEGWDYAKQLIRGTLDFYLVGDFDRVPEGFVRNREALESLCNRATEAMRQNGRESREMNVCRHVLWCKAHGGYIQLRAAVAYRSWRQAQDAHTIAKEMGLTWHGVRQMLCRLCESARALGLETFPRHPTFTGYKSHHTLTQ